MTPIWDRRLRIGCAMLACFCAGALTELAHAAASGVNTGISGDGGNPALVYPRALAERHTPFVPGSFPIPGAAVASVQGAEDVTGLSD